MPHATTPTTSERTSADPSAGRRSSIANDPYIVPREAIYYLLLQRSRYRCQPLYRLFSIVGAGDFYKQRMTRSFIEARRAPAIGRQYQTGIDAILDQVQPWIPSGLTGVIDVGGGIGGMLLGIWRRYHATLTDLYLVDRTEVSPTYYTGYRKEAAFYNSMAVAREFLHVNGVPDEVVHLVDTAQDSFPAGPVQLIISTVAWGFHFPVETYIDAACDALTPNGAIILNVRKGTEGEAVLRRRFESIDHIAEDRRSHLIAASGLRSA